MMMAGSNLLVPVAVSQLADTVSYISLNRISDEDYIAIDRRGLIVGFAT